MPRENRAKYIQAWKNQPCYSCGGLFHHSQMDCHHVNGRDKKGELDKILTNYSSIDEELAKCVPLCKNCHSLYHFLEKKNPGFTLEDFKVR